MPSRILPPKASERKKRSRYPRPLRHAPAVGKRLQFFFRHECLSTQRVCGSARESHLGRIAFSAFPMVRTASGRIAETRHGGLDAAIQSCSAFRRDAVARTVVRDRRRTGRRRGPGRAVGGRGVVRRRCGRRGRLHDGAHCAWLGLAVVAPLSPDAIGQRRRASARSQIHAAAEAEARCGAVRAIAGTDAIRRRRRHAAGAVARVTGVSAPRVCALPPCAC